MKRLCVVLAFLLCLMLCGCADAIKTPAQDKLMADIFNAIENEDYDSVKEMASGVLDDAELDKALPGMSDYINGTISDYTKIGYYYYVSVNNGETRKTENLTYNVKTQYGEYLVGMDLLETADGWKVCGYHITEPSEAPLAGNIIDFNNFDVFQLAMLIFSAACIAFVIYAVVICAKSPIRLKALWIILIILLQAGFILSKTASSQSFNLMIIYVNISNLMKYASGDYIFTLVIPLGAILFLCLRKHLISSAEAYNQRKAAFNAGASENREALSGCNNPAELTGQQPDGAEKEA